MKNTMAKDLQSKINHEDLKKTMILGILKVNINIKIRIQAFVGEAEELEEMTKEVEKAEVEVDQNNLTGKDNIATISKETQKTKVRRIVSILLNLQISMLMLIITQIMKKKKAKIIAGASEDEEEIKIVKEEENVEDKVKDKVAEVEVVEAEVAKEVAVAAEEEEEIQREIHIIKEMQQIKSKATDYVN